MRGHSIIELLVTMALAGILLGIAVSDTRQMLFPGGKTDSLELASLLRTIRRRAINSTSAMIVSSTSSTQVETTIGKECTDASPTPDPSGAFTLSSTASFQNTWKICFNARGYADVNEMIEIADSTSGASTVEVLLGGFVRVLP